MCRVRMRLMKDAKMRAVGGQATQRHKAQARPGWLLGLVGRGGGGGGGGVQQHSEGIGEGFFIRPVYCSNESLPRAPASSSRASRASTQCFHLGKAFRAGCSAVGVPQACDTRAHWTSHTGHFDSLSSWTELRMRMNAERDLVTVRPGLIYLRPVSQCWWSAPNMQDPVPGSLESGGGSTEYAHGRWPGEPEYAREQ